MSGQVNDLSMSRELRGFLSDPTRIWHLLTRNVRRPDEDRLKRSKHVASYTINKIVVLDVYYLKVLVRTHRKKKKKSNFKNFYCLCSQNM